MIALLAALLAQAAPAPSVPPPPGPEQWADLPELAFAESPRDIAGYVFVRSEVEAGRCAHASMDASGAMTVKVLVAVLVAPSGEAMLAVPAAIGCPTVEQYTAGLVQRIARGNVRRPWPAESTWYRTGLSYTWRP